MIKAVFFDLYGTLAGLSPSRYHIQSTACADFSIELTPEGVLKGYAMADAYMAKQNASEPLRRLDAEARTRFFDEYERLVLKGSGVEVSGELAGEIWRRVRQVPYQMAVFDDVPPTLDLLRSQGLTLGLISNMNRPGHELAEGLGLTPYLDLTVTSAEVGAEKPHAPIFQAALAKAGAEPAESVHVGDQLTSDVEGARGVGITPVLIDRDGNHRGVEDPPRIEILSELPDVLGAIASAAE